MFPLIKNKECAYGWILTVALLPQNDERVEHPHLIWNYPQINAPKAHIPSKRYSEIVAGVFIIE